MALLLHGTTLHRAGRIQQLGPDPNFIEPHGERAEMFCALRPFVSRADFGWPEDYACAKAGNCPEEGGPAILLVDVPYNIIELTLDEFFTWSHGSIQFEGVGLKELRAVWKELKKRILVLGCS